MSSLRPYSGQIAAGSAAAPSHIKFTCTGNFVYIKSTTGEMLATLLQGKPGSTGRALADRIPINARQSTETKDGEEFDQIVLENVSGNVVDFVIIAGRGGFDAPLSQVSLDGPNDIDDFADIDVQNVAIQVCAADSDRRRIHIVAHPSNDQNIRIGTQASVAAGRGLCLAPGIGITIEGSQAIFAIEEVAGVTLLTAIAERRT